jgi:hypothetical protein
MKTTDVEYIVHPLQAEIIYDVARCISSYGCVNGISDYHAPFKCLILNPPDGGGDHNFA